MSTANASFLREAAFHKRNPESSKQQRGILLAKQAALRLYQEGKLTKREFDDFDARCWEKAIDILPADESSIEVLSELQELAGHDGSRDDYSVKQARDAVENKIAAEIIHSRWLNQEISTKEAAEMHQQHVSTNEGLDTRIAEGDYDGAMSEMFAEQHDAPANHDGPLAKFMHQKYGEKAPDAVSRSNSEDVSEQDKILDSYLEERYGENGGHSAPPPGEVERETILDPGIRLSNRAGNRHSDGIIDHDAPEGEAA